MGREQGDQLKDREPRILFRGSKDDDTYEEKPVHSNADMANAMARGWQIKSDDAPSSSTSRSSARSSRAATASSAAAKSDESEHA